MLIEPNSVDNWIVEEFVEMFTNPTSETFFKAPLKKENGDIVTFWQIYWDTSNETFNTTRVFEIIPPSRTSRTPKSQKSPDLNVSYYIYKTLTLKSIIPLEEGETEASNEELSCII